MVETINSIKLSGCICAEPEYDHTIYGEAFYNITAAVARLSGTMDYLPITVSERLLGDADVFGCEAGTFLSLSGQVRSYNRMSGEKSRLIVTVFAKELEFSDPNEKTAEDAGAEENGAREQRTAKDACVYRNEVELCGSLCKPVIYRTTPFNREIADLLIAVNRRYGKSDYLPCIAWGRNARFADSLEVGDGIYVKGRMQSRSYQKTLPDGTSEQRVAYEISCSAIEKREQW